MWCARKIGEQSADLSGAESDVGIQVGSTADRHMAGQKAHGDEHDQEGQEVERLSAIP